MDDSGTVDGGRFDRRISLDTSSFGQREREQFGQNIGLTMERIGGTSEPVEGKAMPLDEAAQPAFKSALARDHLSSS